MTSRTYVFLHGSPGRRDNWAPLLEHAPPGTRCEAWDLLDHGERHAPDATLEDTVADVVARARGLDGPFTLVGHSFGSWVGAHALGPLGERVERFVSIAGLPSVPAELTASWAGLAPAIETGQVPLAAAAHGAAANWLTANDPSPDHLARIVEMIESDGPACVARGLRRLAGMSEPSRDVRPYTTPTTCIHCAGDRAVPIAFGRALAALGADARFVELEGDDHFPHWARPAIVAELVFGS